MKKFKYLYFSNIISNSPLYKLWLFKKIKGDEPEPPVPPAPTVNALMFTSKDSQTLSIDNTKLGTISPNFEYSTDGENWETWNVTTQLSFGNGIVLYIRGMNDFLAKGGTNYVNFTFSTNSSVNCSGNLMHLFDYTQDLTAFPGDETSRGVKYLFANCSQLVTAPDLPATSLYVYCYYYMFQNCTSLIRPPYLPAINLVNNVYTGMFDGCTSLNELPSLTHAIVSGGCFINMFKGCTNIKMSSTQTGDYQNVFTLQNYASAYCDNMFTNTGGTLTGTPTDNTIYTSNKIRLS